MRAKLRLCQHETVSALVLATVLLHHEAVIHAGLAITAARREQRIAALLLLLRETIFGRDQRCPFVAHLDPRQFQGDALSFWLFILSRLFESWDKCHWTLERFLVDTVAKICLVLLVRRVDLNKARVVRLWALIRDSDLITRQCFVIAEQDGDLALLSLLNWRDDGTFEGLS